MSFIVQTAGGIGDNHITASCLSGRDGIKNDSRRVRTFILLDDIRTGSVRPDLELVNGRRTEGIRRRQSNTLSLFDKTCRHFTDGGRFADTINADNQNNGGFGIHLQSLTALQHFSNDLRQQTINHRRVGNASLFDTLTQFVTDFFRGFNAHIAHH